MHDENRLCKRLNTHFVAVFMSENTIHRPLSRKSRQDLLGCLDTLGIAHNTVDHQPVFTVAESSQIKAKMPGGHSKNLFLKDKKGSRFLAVAHADTKVDLVALGKVIGAKGRLSFGKPELMTATLGVEPGAVTPFALINTSPQDLASVVIDRALLNYDPVWFHPLENQASTAVSPADLIKFIENCGITPRILELADPAKG